MKVLAALLLLTPPVAAPAPAPFVDDQVVYRQGDFGYSSPARPRRDPPRKTCRPLATTRTCVGERPAPAAGSAVGSRWTAWTAGSRCRSTARSTWAAQTFTLTAWIRYAEPAKQGAILWAYRMGSGTTPQIWLRAEPASKRIRALMAVDRFTVSVASTAAYNDGAWHHVALRRAGGRLALLVDGVEVASATAPPGSVTAGKEFGVQGIHIGQRVDGADRFRGTLDEVRVYRRPLSGAELRLIREGDAPLGGRLGLRLPF